VKFTYLEFRHTAFSGSRVGMDRWTGGVFIRRSGGMRKHSETQTSTPTHVVTLAPIIYSSHRKLT